MFLVLYCLTGPVLAEPGLAGEQPQAVFEAEPQQPNAPEPRPVSSPSQSCPDWILERSSLSEVW